MPTDQRLEGPHGLTFRTPVLTAPRRMVGPIALHLVAASTATDTDWYAKLADVAPDGSESIITEGALRASHRAIDPAKSIPGRPYHTHTDPQPIDPNRFYDYDIEIWPTAYELASGHRLQLRLTSTDLPTHMPGSIFLDRNRVRDTRIELLSAATNTVRLKESFLLLPIAGASPPTASVVDGGTISRAALDPRMGAGRFGGARGLPLLLVLFGAVWIAARGGWRFVTTAFVQSVAALG